MAPKMQFIQAGSDAFENSQKPPFLPCDGMLAQVGVLPKRLNEKYEGIPVFVANGAQNARLVGKLAIFDK